MRILVTSFPALGHFVPLAPFVAAAATLGHQVKVVSGADLCRWVTDAGFDAHPVGATQADLINTTRATYGDVSSEHLFTDVWVTAALPAMLDVARSWRPDLIVHEEEEYTALLVADLLGLRAVTHSWNSPARASTERAAAADLLSRLWTTHCPRLQPRTIGEAYLDACPPPLQDHHEISQISNVMTVRPESFALPITATTALPSSIPRPGAYLTLGTVPVFSTPGRLRHLVDALSPHLATVIVTTGPNPVESLGPLPSNVYAFQHLPQADALSSVDVVVSQGGAGGTLGAIEHGLPHLVIPFESQSQLALAAAVERLGAGRQLAPDQRDPGTIRAAVTDLLRNPDYRQAADALRRDLDLLPSARDTIKRLEHTVRTPPAAPSPTQTHPPGQRR